MHPETTFWGPASRAAAALLAALLTLLLLGGCRQQSGADSPGALGPGVISIVTTTGMIGDAVGRVGGDRVAVKSLMGPGIDPHLYKASEGDVRRLSQADIIFYNGLHLEARMGDVLEGLGARRRVVAVAETIDPSLLLSYEGAEGSHDPHVWFDAELWMKVVERIRDTLVEADADGAEVYQTNTEKYLEELREIHQYVRSQAESIPAPQRVVITAHDAFKYFGRAYGFEVRGLQGISTASEAGASDVNELATFIAERRIPALFVESSVPRRNVEAVQQAVAARGFEVKLGGELYSDALGDAGTPAGTYLGMMRHNVDTIVSALRGQP